MIVAGHSGSYIGGVPQIQWCFSGKTEKNDEYIPRRQGSVVKSAFLFRKANRSGSCAATPVYVQAGGLYAKPKL
jgi:hypothetical protein